MLTLRERVLFHERWKALRARLAEPSGPGEPWTLDGERFVFPVEAMDRYVDAELECLRSIGRAIIKTLDDAGHPTI